MSVSTTDVKNIAHLARLQLNESDIQAYTAHLSGILGLVAQMSAVDTEGIAPMAHSQTVYQRLRSDVITEKCDEGQREILQRGAPAVKLGLYLVPKVME